MNALQNILAKKTVLVLIVVSVAALFVIINFSYRSWRAASDPNEVLPRTIARAVEENMSKLSCARLTWNSEYKGFGLWSDKPQTVGQHQLWLVDDKIAVLSEVSTSIPDPNGKVSSNDTTNLMTYDGKTFRATRTPSGSGGKTKMLISNQPPNNWHKHNYLQRVRWQPDRALINVSRGTEPGIEQWRTEEGSVIVRTFRNARTGQVGVWTYDIEKAYGLITYENYAKEDVLQSRTTTQYTQVSGGAWFPTSVIREGYNIQNGDLLSRSKMVVDLNKSAFNEPSEIPDDVFEIEVDPNTEVIDLTALEDKTQNATE
ncbi:MAG: hypothetical protein ACYSWQ_20625 [Planctomycetota bacterium]|jgi:hypothetical protein